MVKKIYNIEYLPIAISDLQRISDYITFELKAPLAAIKLIDKFDKLISNLEVFPLSGVRYKGNKLLEHDYRILLVENYIVFYTVLENTVEIHRIIYSKRKLDEFL